MMIFYRMQLTQTGGDLYALLWLPLLLFLSLVLFSNLALRSYSYR